MTLAYIKNDLWMIVSDIEAFFISKSLRTCLSSGKKNKKSILLLKCSPERAVAHLNFYLQLLRNRTFQLQSVAVNQSPPGPWQFQILLFCSFALIPELSVYWRMWSLSISTVYHRRDTSRLDNKSVHTCSASLYTNLAICSRVMMGNASVKKFSLKEN